MAAVRRADVAWSGNLASGKGNVSASTSGVFKGLEVSWPRRSEADANGITSPEELLAAAHASCYAMALSGGHQAAPLVALAEAVSVQRQDVQQFESLLNQALAIDPEAKPEWRLVNLAMQRRAKWLLGRTDKLFLIKDASETKKP